MKQVCWKWAILAVMTLMLCGVLCGCDAAPANDDPATPDTTTTAATKITIPTYVREDATGSVFIGTWVVDSHGATPLNEITFHEDGSLIVKMDESSLGGGFYIDGDQIKIVVASTEKVFTYVADGSIITMESEAESWMLTKIA